MNPIAEMIGSNIRERMAEKNVSAEQLAEGINVTLETLNRWIAGRRQITSYALYRVSVYLEAPMESFMRGVQPVE